MSELPTLAQIEANLTERRKRFVVEYCNDFNATQAAIRAGFSENGAGQMGHELLKNREVKEAIRIRRNELDKSTAITKSWIVERLARIAGVDMRDVASWGPEDFKNEMRDGTIVASNGITLKQSDELTDAAAYAVAEIGNTKEGVKIKLQDRQAALMNLAKLHGYVIDKAELTGKDGAPIGVQIDLSKLTKEELEAYRILAIAAERNRNT